jgi:asparagine synthase (glutamine-hydrolysing)
VCAICGIVERGRPAQRETVDAMAQSMHHRGPDSRGVFAADGVALASCRLAVIDPRPEGRQPVATEDGLVQLVYNGEVYNYRELRAELEPKGHRFRTQTDTEVVLRAYEEWGERCIERFNGMWALALWDGRRDLLFCSRDRFGVKPFYYRLAGDRLAFASELKAFRHDPETALRPNLAVVRDYLELARIDHTDETFFEGIRQLPPAHSLVFDGRGFRIERYWELQPRAAPAGDAAPLVRELFFDAVRLRLRSDVAVGTCLSGGLDSSILVGVAAALLRDEADAAESLRGRLETFTAWFPDAGLEERPYAEAVAEHTGAHPHWITFGSDELAADLPTIVDSQDEPFGSASIAAQWYVMRAAREAGITVMLDGQGADETFAGYGSLAGERFADLVRTGQVGALRRESAAYRAETGASPVAVAAQIGRAFARAPLERRLAPRLSGAHALVHRDLRAYGPSPVRHQNGFPDLLRRRLALMVARRGLPELLHSEDRNSMAHSIEARVPFLDYRLVELVFSLGAEERIADGRTKAVLRRALGDLLPQTVRDRRTKLGFPAPGSRFLREAVGQLAADAFASEPFRARGWVDPQAAQRLLERHRAGKTDAGFTLWRALNLELWARAFLDTGGAGPPL